jgi:hypothetical protein
MSYPDLVQNRPDPPTLPTRREILRKTWHNSDFSSEMEQVQTWYTSSESLKRKHFSEMMAFSSRCLSPVFDEILQSFQPRGERLAGGASLLLRLLHQPVGTVEELARSIFLFRYFLWSIQPA